ncbi:putative signal transduction protein with CBS domains [Desulfobulbus propionicus DSM 2032]|jgi:CBS domain-containing protein|uniref:Signal transduction protein with CBS domains n=1 Tax=Desulfobulbus propionicus (strain ATCC 33891 / DSM 2032 / VKM B-1956 / 1pr3) TaxID=577650 RepID=A0A7U3YLE3_DESPD|nr:CBS domain-containing protein [Desulfobulbus propionicus]ADW17510.1 putative signal transduction protein with CBS domains [Desulfobulbus propionicus DSM 2032]
MKTQTNSIIRVREVMSTRLITIDGMATVREAAATMRAERVHSLLVNKRHADDAWGIVSVQDIINGVLIPGKRAEEVNVYEIMTKPVMTVPADMDIRYIARLLHRVGMRRAPVEENGQIIGMVTLSALVLDNDLFLR